MGGRSSSRRKEGIRTRKGKRRTEPGRGLEMTTAAAPAVATAATKLTVTKLSKKGKNISSLSESFIFKDRYTAAKLTVTKLPKNISINFSNHDGLAHRLQDELAQNLNWPGKRF